MVLGDLEGLAGRLACEHATDAEIQEVRRLHDRMMDMYAKRDRLPYFKLNQNIHSAILRLSKNEALAYVHSILQARLRRIRYIGNEGPEKWAGAVADHEEIISALEARELRAAVKSAERAHGENVGTGEARDLEPASPLAPASPIPRPQSRPTIKRQGSEC